MKGSYFFFVLICVFFTLPLFAQLTPQEAIEDMGRGINLGNTLEPPTEGSWNNGPAQEAYFDAYLEAGFNNIRVPVRWDRHTGSAAPYAISESWMDRVEEVIDWGLSRGFYITLNGHHEDWLKTNYSNQILQDRYDAIWVQVAERFKDKSDKLLFEIINEPKGMSRGQVDDLNQRILGIIRATNPTRIVIYGGNEWANSPELLNAAIPDDDYLIGYYHAYDPWNFSGLGMGTWGTANDYQQVTNKYKSVKNWSMANNIPVHHSEFGALVTCDFNSRMRIYAHNVEQCIVNGFAFSVWDDGGDFKVLNRGSNTWPEIKDVLMHYHEDSPNQVFSTLTVDPSSNDTSIVIDWNNRTTSTNNIIVERMVGANSDFIQIADLPSDATTFEDVNVEEGRTYTYRMFTYRADGTLLHGYPTRTRIIGTNQFPYKGTAISIPGILEVEEYDEGGEGLAYHDSDAANVAGSFRSDEGVDIGGDSNSGYILGYVAAGEWLEYRVNVSQAGKYSVKAELASEQSNGRFSISFEKNNASTNFVSPNTGGWNTFQERNASSIIELEAGEQQVRLAITGNAAFNIDNLTFTLEEATTSLNEVDNIAKGLSIAPNPTHGVLNINLKNALKDPNNRLELFRITGEKVATFRMDGEATSLDLNKYESGLYLLRLVNDDINLVHRIVKY